MAVSVREAINCRVEFESVEKLTRFLEVCLQAVNYETGPDLGQWPRQSKHVRAAKKALARCNSERLTCERSLTLTAYDWNALLAVVAAFGINNSEVSTVLRDVVFPVLGQLEKGRIFVRIHKAARRYASLANAAVSGCARLMALRKV